MADGYTKEQLRIARRIQMEGRRRYPDDPAKRRRYINAGLATGLVESNLQNLSGGDADSAGWRQERASLYDDPTNVKHSVDRFFNELEQHDHGQDPGTLAADVQRPAEQYRGRYAERLDDANHLRHLLGRSADRPRSAASGTPARLGTPGTVKPGTAPGYTPAREEVDTKGAIIDALLQPGHGGLLKRAAANVQSGKYTTEIPSQITDGKAARYVPGTPGNPGVQGRMPEARGGGPVKKILKDANLLDQANNAGKLPYLWGGGHAGKLARGSKPTPVDCSGAVSRVLGIDPRVSGDLAKWGAPGEGSRVTIYANPEHVLLKIDGRYWGTSASNPGGGAGWIPSSQISREYLSGFTARHPHGM